MKELTKKRVRVGSDIHGHAEQTEHTRPADPCYAGLIDKRRRFVRASRLFGALRLVIASCLCACVADPIETTRTLVPVVVMSVPLERNACEPVATEPPCADACDPEAVLEQVPPGTCEIIECELVDGTSVRVGGCR
jgi:hypothetical protein